MDTTKLTKVGLRFERYLAHFPRGTSDETWLPMVGSKGWILLTADKRIRYNFLEKRALQKHAVRELVFASGNMSGEDMGAALERIAKRHGPGSFPADSCPARKRGGEIQSGVSGTPSFERLAAPPLVLRVLDAIPRTSVGKFKKIALRERFADWKWE